MYSLQIVSRIEVSVSSWSTFSRDSEETWKCTVKSGWETTPRTSARCRVSALQKKKNENTYYFREFISVNFFPEFESHLTLVVLQAHWRSTHEVRLCSCVRLALSDCVERALGNADERHVTVELWRHEEKAALADDEACGDQQENGDAVRKNNWSGMLYLIIF